MGDDFFHNVRKSFQVVDGEIQKFLGQFAPPAEDEAQGEGSPSRERAVGRRKDGTQGGEQQDDRDSRVASSSSGSGRGGRNTDDGVEDGNSGSRRKRPSERGKNHERERDVRGEDRMRRERRSGGENKKTSGGSGATPGSENEDNDDKKARKSKDRPLRRSQQQTMPQPMNGSFPPPHPPLSSSSSSSSSTSSSEANVVITPGPKKEHRSKRKQLSAAGKMSKRTESASGNVPAENLGNKRQGRQVQEEGDPGLGVSTSGTTATERDSTNQNVGAETTSNTNVGKKTTNDDDVFVYRHLVVLMHGFVGQAWHFRPFLSVVQNDLKTVEARENARKAFLAQLGDEMDDSEEQEEFINGAEIGREEIGSSSSSSTSQDAVGRKAGGNNNVHDRDVKKTSSGSSPPAESSSGIGTGIGAASTSTPTNPEPEPEIEVVFHAAQGNDLFAGKGSTDGVHRGGSRLAKEIATLAKTFAQRDGKPLKYLTLIGHSMGGLYARYALRVLNEKGWLDLTGGSDGENEGKDSRDARDTSPMSPLFSKESVIREEGSVGGRSRDRSVGTSKETNKDKDGAVVGEDQESHPVSTSTTKMKHRNYIPPDHINQDSGTASATASDNGNDGWLNRPISKESSKSKRMVVIRPSDLQPRLTSRSSSGRFRPLKRAPPYSLRMRHVVCKMRLRTYCAIASPHLGAKKPETHWSHSIWNTMSRTSAFLSVTQLTLHDGQEPPKEETGVGGVGEGQQQESRGVGGNVEKEEQAEIGTDENTMEMDKVGKNVDDPLTSGLFEFWTEKQQTVENEVGSPRTVARSSTNSSSPYKKSSGSSSSEIKKPVFQEDRSSDGVAASSSLVRMEDKPLLYRMACDPIYLEPLQGCYRHILYADVAHDWVVPYTSASLRPLNPYFIPGGEGMRDPEESDNVEDDEDYANDYTNNDENDDNLQLSVAASAPDPDDGNTVESKSPSKRSKDGGSSSLRKAASAPGSKVTTSRRSKNSPSSSSKQNQTSSPKTSGPKRTSIKGAKDTAGGKGSKNNLIRDVFAIPSSETKNKNDPSIDNKEKDNNNSNTPGGTLPKNSSFSSSRGSMSREFDTRSMLANVGSDSNTTIVDFSASARNFDKKTLARPQHRKKQNGHEDMDKFREGYVEGGALINVVDSEPGTSEELSDDIYNSNSNSLGVGGAEGATGATGVERADSKRKNKSKDRDHSETEVSFIRDGRPEARSETRSNFSKDLSTSKSPRVKIRKGKSPPDSAPGLSKNATSSASSSLNEWNLPPNMSKRSVTLMDESSKLVDPDSDTLNRSRYTSDSDGSDADLLLRTSSRNSITGEGSRTRRAVPRTGLHVPRRPYLADTNIVKSSVLVPDLAYRVVRKRLRQKRRTEQRKQQSREGSTSRPASARPSLVFPSNIGSTSRSPSKRFSQFLHPARNKSGKNLNNNPNNNNNNNNDLTIPPRALSNTNNALKPHHARCYRSAEERGPELSEMIYCLDNAVEWERYDVDSDSVAAHMSLMGMPDTNATNVHMLRNIVLGDPKLFLTKRDFVFTDDLDL